MKFEATEYDECVLLVDYLDQLVNMKKVRMYTHIPNETYTTSWSVKRKNKALGVKKGFPDYVILFNDYTLFLEMKREKKGVVSKEQRQWLFELAKLGHRTHVAHGFDDAKEIVDSLC